MHTINAGTLKDLAGFAGRSQAITFDLAQMSMLCDERFMKSDHLSLPARLAIHALSRLII
jgi:hypothetical protein